MLRIALTGNIASGKSTVARRWIERGATVIDADKLARDAVALGEPVLDQIAARWGRSVLTPQGSLDRAALRRIVFANESERLALNAIVHPRVEERRRRLLDEASARGERLVVSDIPLLFENGLQTQFDVIVHVHAPDDVRLERLMQLRGLSESESRSMIAAQLPSEEKRARADEVIDNTGSLEQLQVRADAVWDVLLERAERSTRVS